MLKEILSQLRTARVGETVWLFDEASRDEVDQQIEAAMLQGDTKYNRDGSREWIEDVELFDATKSGSDRYTWDKSGNRIKYNRCRFVADASGKVSCKVIKSVYKNWA